jgi:hypothetical protein
MLKIATRENNRSYINMMTRKKTPYWIQAR